MSYISPQDSNCTANKKWCKGNPDFDGLLSIIIFGASGNLAINKVNLLIIILNRHFLHYFLYSKMIIYLKDL